MAMSSVGVLRVFVEVGCGDGSAIVSQSSCSSSCSWPSPVGIGVRRVSFIEDR